MGYWHKQLRLLDEKSLNASIQMKPLIILSTLMALVEEYTGKVDFWRNSFQKQSRVATALLEIEPRPRRIKGYRNLPELREALKQRLRLYREAA